MRKSPVDIVFQYGNYQTSVCWSSFSVAASSKSGLDGDCWVIDVYAQLAE